MRVKQDHTGKRYGRLVAIREVGKTKGRQIVWEFVCDCGNTTQVTASSAKAGQIVSCGCLKLDRIREANTKHGWAGTKEYLTWKNINTRCYNPNRKDWYRYGGVGLTFDYSEDFIGFLEDVGEAPDDKTKWSIDRIDPTRGYIKGNMRWATIEQQSKNKRMQTNNTSGKTGVSWKQNSNSLYAFAFWKEGGKPKSKYFSVKKYGLLEAYAMACKHREDAIKSLIDRGESYTEQHGTYGGF